MNDVTLLGRLVRDPEIRTGKNDFVVATYTLAVDRPWKNKDGEREADFIRCQAFGGAAEFAETYLAKGDPILVKGRIQTGSYENEDGETVYTTDVIVQTHEFIPAPKKERKDSEENTASRRRKGSRK